MKRKTQEYTEPEWYGKAKYVNERKFEADWTGLERLSDEEIFGLELIAIRQNKKGLLEAATLEEKRRYLLSIIRLCKGFDKGMPKSEEARERALEQVNEIIRKGFNDYQEDLFCVWPDIQGDADRLAAKLPDCPAKQRYGVARNLVGALTYNVAEKVVATVREEEREDGKKRRKRRRENIEDW